MKLKETYQQIKTRHQEEVNSFDKIFFAFSNEQFNEGLAKLNTDTKSIISIGSGGFVLKSHLQEFKGIFKRHKEEMKQFRKDKKNLLETLTYELRNHEYGYTYDETDALEALGLTIEDVPVDIMKKAKALAV